MSLTRSAHPSTLQVDISEVMSETGMVWLGQMTSQVSLRVRLMETMKELPKFRKGGQSGTQVEPELGLRDRKAQA